MMKNTLKAEAVQSRYPGGKREAGNVYTDPPPFSIKDVSVFNAFLHKVVDSKWMYIHLIHCMLCIWPACKHWAEVVLLNLTSMCYSAENSFMVLSVWIAASGSSVFSMTSL